jgi:hypothetical protein
MLGIFFRHKKCIAEFSKTLMGNIMKKLHGGLGITLMLASMLAHAGVLNINFSDSGIYNGTLIPSGAAVWATASFEDVGANQVKLTMNVDSSLFGTNLYVNAWYFNVTGALGSVSAAPDSVGFTNIVADSIHYGASSPPLCCSLGP